MCMSGKAYNWVLRLPPKAVLSGQSNMVNNKNSSFFIGVGVCKGEKMAGTKRDS